MDVESSDATRPPRRVRWWLLVAIVAASGALLGGLQVPDLFPDDAHRNLATLAAMGLVAGLLTLWTVLGTGLSGRQQVRTLLGVALAVAMAVGCVRVEGCSGNLTPRLTWRWKPKPDESLATVGDEKSSAELANVADLSSTGEHDFPQFLGPNRDASVEAPAFGTDWSAHPPHLLWRQPIGAGWSSFALVGDYAVTQEQRGDDECVTCYALDGGKLLWTHADPGRFSHPMSGDGPRATPTVDEGRVYTLGAFGRLNCLDGRSGKLVWTHDIVKENDARPPQWGKSCSPLVVGDLVIASAGGLKGWSLVAYNKQTGEVVWHAGDAPSSYASPRLAEMAGMRQVLMVNADSVTGHDPDDGRVLWRFKWPGGQPKVPDAVALGGDQVFISAGYGLGCKLLEIGPSGEGGSPRVVWESNKLKPKFTNVVVRDGYVYGLDDGRTLNCLDLNDGKVRWRGGRYGHGQILLVNDLLLVQAELGDVALVKASPERFTELTRFAALQGQTWNNPVVAGRLLLVRNATEAACYELRVGD
ncbi:MAG TPA: PQQ-binding-like beta-propeller repeat protein [Pirellulales bacterium]|nr:PQQ-binding-like beta-propeller repeat protein [Pirellulales bacterium]